MIFFFATEPHFRDHMRPLHAAVSETHPETSYVTDPEALRAQFDSLDPDEQFNSLVVTCSIGDYRRVHKICPKIILCEHGAGQSYSSRHPSYVGGTGRGSAVAFLVPNEQARARSLQFYPLTPAYVVGCPKLDKWAGFRPTPKPKPLVVVSFHFDLLVNNETRSSFIEYANPLAKLKAQPEYDLAVHCHPRIRSTVSQWATAHKVRYIEEFEEVMQAADCYCIDNSSTLFEFAATDRPVVVVNSKHYRRHANHGLRFWDCAKVGVNCNSPEDLHTSILLALSDTPEQRTLRQSITDKVYAVPLGQATEAAVHAILQTAERVKYMPQHDQIVLRAKRTVHGVFGAVVKGELIEVNDDHCYVVKRDGTKTRRKVNMLTTARTLARQCVSKGPYELALGDLKIATPEHSPRPQPKTVYAGRKKRPRAPLNKMATRAPEDKGETIEADNSPPPPHLAFETSTAQAAVTAISAVGGARKEAAEAARDHEEALNISSKFETLDPIEQQLVIAQVSKSKKEAIAEVAEGQDWSREAVGVVFDELVNRGALRLVPGRGYEVTEEYAPLEGIGYERQG